MNILIDIGGKEEFLSLKDAKLLYDQLGDLLYKDTTLRAVAETIISSKLCADAD